MIIIKDIILKEVRDMLREGLTNVSKPTRMICRTVDERVPPSSGEEFFGAYGGEASVINQPSDITKVIGYGFTVAYTRRLQGIPNELAGEQALSVDSDINTPLKIAMYRRADEIVAILGAADGWTLINRINQAVCDAGGVESGFVIPFGFVSVDPVPRKVDAEHFDIEAGREGIRYTGLLMELEFGGAEYMKPSPPPVPVE